MDTEAAIKDTQRRSARAKEAQSRAASGRGGLDDPLRAETPPNPREELRMSARMIRTWMPESFPANELGQVHFVRCVIDAVAEAIERFLMAPDAAIQPSEAHVKHMVDRFLGWKLPDSFSPDGGISFKKFGNEGTAHQYEHQPSGTNLLDATQATAMVRYLIEGLSGLPDPVEQERGELAYHFRALATEHKALAHESGENGEREDQDSHEFEASIWNSAADLVSARGNPVHPVDPISELPDDEIAF